jgi:steroid 5-alpha reductase family enzyme
MLITGLIVTVFAILIWVGSVAVKDASIIDRFWGIGFIVVCFASLLQQETVSSHSILLLLMTTVWGLRLSAHITWRNWGTGEDYRYVAMREKHGNAFAWKSLFTVFLLQGFLTWFISLPLQFAMSAGQETTIGGVALSGTALFLIGFAFECIGDWQLARFKAAPENKGKVMDRGLWRYTRHPNYFGDAVLWWGLFLTALPAPGVVYTLLSPLVMTGFLMNVSGVPLLEKRMAKTRPAYAEYVARTPTFFPWWPRN